MTRAAAHRPTERGRTTYRVTGPDRVEVLDEVRQGEAWRPFGRATCRRVDPAGR